MNDSSDDAPRKRSVLLSPVGIGAMALLGTGAFAATNGFGLGGRPCTVTRVATSAIECQAIGAGPACAAALAAGTQAVGLSRSGNSSAWSQQPLRAATGGGYQTMAGSPFAINAACTRSSSSSSGRSSFYWGGGSSYDSSRSSSSSASSSSSRGGFGVTSSSFSSRGS